MASNQLSKFLAGTGDNRVYVAGALAIPVLFVLIAHLLNLTDAGQLVRGVFWFTTCALILLHQNFHSVRLRQMTLPVITVIVVYATYSLLKILYLDIHEPHEWDFLAKYIEGSMGVRGLNFYEPQNYVRTYEALDTPIQASSEFRREILQVGFKYFPPAIFFFMPTGLFDYTEAQIIWFTMQFGFLMAAVFFLTNFFYLHRKRSLIDYLFIFSLVALFPATQDIFFFGQTHFIILFFVALMLIDLERSRSGIWVAFGSFVKPFGALLGLVYLLRRRWQAILFGVATGVLAFLLTGVIFGFELLQTFFLNNPTQSAPDWQYTQSINQSLASVIIRLTEIDLDATHPLLNYSVLSAIGILTVFSSVLIVRVCASKLHWAFALSLTLAVLVYPGALEHYSVYLLIPILLILLSSDFPIKSAQLKMALMLTLWILLSKQAFLANLGCWLVMAVTTYYFGAQRRTYTTKDS